MLRAHHLQRGGVDLANKAAAMTKIHGGFTFHDDDVALVIVCALVLSRGLLPSALAGRAGFSSSWTVL